jgi:hypothetical protein
LSDIQQIYTLLQQVDALLDQVNIKLDTTTRKAQTTALAYRDLYNVVQDVFVILRHAGLPEEHAATLAFMQRMITTAYSLIIAVNALNAAMAASPAGWAIAGLGFAATLLSSISMVGSFG